MKGYIHIYTGNGKGKSTAAFGLALRAVGDGKRVYIGQFVKGRVYSEVIAIRKYLPGITVRQFGRGCFIINSPTEEDVKLAREGLAEVGKVLISGEYDIAVLDEVTIALYYNLFSVQELIDLLKKRANNMEIIITGRYSPAELIDFADLVTDMREVKHYYQQGVKAREGIEF